MLMRSLSFIDEPVQRLTLSSPDAIIEQLASGLFHTQQASDQASKKTRKICFKEHDQILI